MIILSHQVSHNAAELIRLVCRIDVFWTSLVIQWLRSCTFNAGGTGSTPDWGTRSHIPQDTVGKKKKKESVCSNQPGKLW